MSSRTSRPALGGVIVLHDRVVGGVDLSVLSEQFIAQFNREYAALGLRVQPTVPPASASDGTAGTPLP